jgi:hypothetical protein
VTLPLLRIPSVGLTGSSAPAPLINRDQQPNLPTKRPDLSHGSSPPAAKRSKIWELAATLHCSIIGTCLSNAELRHVLVRLNVPGADAADDHELHILGVTLASRRDAGAKFVQKALDRRHGLTIKHYGRAKDEDALRRLWDESVQHGDIPGAYWALLSHPAATDAIVKQAFQHVHMLSHLVGAANRADIRRLRQLEEENAALVAKVNRQQTQLRDGFASRDNRIRQLNELIARQAERPPELKSVGPANQDEVEALAAVLADLNRKLGQETTRRDRLEQRLNAVSGTLRRTEAALKTAESNRDASDRDIEIIENHFARLLQPGANEGNGTLDLSGRTILYVGGRTHQIPQFKALVERTGACFLHHDGGIEHSPSLLPGLISRADVLCFPIDCISHNAVGIIKRLCRQWQKPYRPLRTASLAALMSSLTTMFTEHAAGAAT